MNRKLKLEELNRINIEAFKSSIKMPIIVILNDIRSLQNIGSIFRTSDAFRIQEIWLQGITAQPPHREINKTALGATNSVSWKYFETEKEIIEAAQKLGVDLFSIEQTTKSIMLSKFSLDNDKTYGLVFGNEVNGVSDYIIGESKACIEIPQFGTKHSLNVSISVGITLWEMVRSRTLTTE